MDSISSNEDDEEERHKVCVVHHGNHGLPLHEKYFMRKYDRHANATGEEESQFCMETSFETTLNEKQKVKRTFISPLYNAQVSIYFPPPSFFITIGVDMIIRVI